MQFDIITIFPEIFNSYLNESILARAVGKKFIKIKTHTPRKFARDVHKTVDGKPYGGGPGMVLMFEPIVKTLTNVRKKNKKIRTVLLTPAGKQFTQKDARRLAKYDQLIFVCGRYEGVDARLEKVVDEKISIGPYVLSGGELPALVITEAVSRMIPGVLGKQESLAQESFNSENYLEHPHYTRPEKVKWQGKDLKVPKVLLSGNHAKISEWRRKFSRFEK